MFKRDGGSRLCKKMMMANIWISWWQWWRTGQHGSRKGPTLAVPVKIPSPFLRTTQDLKDYFERSLINQ
ncbi:hypothetical protein Y1Q_0004570 [Alligator mississippiensis]|uniref:Uncharacterized protein n=1 Tax=Alligator mississippiensis TaxID=8496 RepID=A0A151MHH4_ALLMI|nr:hypothetical protein Y1Q_0004570 [Alligator mississippiensis]